MAAVALRFASLGTLPLWMDEASSVWFSDQSYGYLWTVVPQFENHPSLYYIILKTWRGIAGSTEFDLRTPSAIFSLGTILCLFASGRILGDALQRGQGRRLGLMAATLAAFSQFQIAFAQEARPYAMACFGVALMMAGMLAIITASGKKGVITLPTSAALVLGMALTLWSHVLGLLPAGLAGLFLILWWFFAARAKPALFLRLVILAGLVLLISLPHLRNVVALSGRDYGDFWIAPPDLKQLIRVTALATGMPGLPGGTLVQGAFAAFCLPLGLWGIWRMGADGGGVLVRFWALVLLLVLSAGFLAILVLYTYLVQPVFLPRTVIFIQPAILLITAAAPWVFGGRARSIIASVVVALAIVAAFSPRAVQIYSRKSKDAVALIHAQKPDTPVLALAGDSQWLMNYYENRLGVDLDIRPVPGPFPQMKDGLPDFINRQVVDRATADAAVAALGDAPVVWLMMRMSHFSDSGIALRDALRASGRSETVVIGGTARDQISLFRFDLGDRPAAQAGQDG